MGAWGLIFVTIALACDLVTSNRLKERIYNDADSGSIRSCFRRLNGTTTIGCTSSIKGDVGVMIYLNTMEDIQHIRDEEFAPYSVLVNPEIFSEELLTQLQDIGHISGVILPNVIDPDSTWYGRQPPGGYSDDSKCPGDVAQCSEDDPWNPAGSGVMWKNFEFPIFYIPDTATTESLYKCFLEHNNVTAGLSWPLCSVQMGANMHAAMDSETCVRRSNLQNSLEPPHFCDPLSDVSLHYFVTSREVAEAEDSVLLVTARLDTLTMFDQTEVGFDSPSTGLVTLLTAAKLVSETMRQKQLQYVAGVDNIMFLLLNGESFDASGSSRLLYDMKHNQFPETQEVKLGLESIASVLELGQLSNVAEDKVFLHTANSPSAMEAKITEYARAQQLATQRSARASLPPSSAAQLLKERGELGVVMLSNFDTEYSSKYHHSLYDSPAYHGYNYSQGAGQGAVQHLAKVGVVVARTLLSLATNTDQLTAPSSAPALVLELLQCFTLTANCTMFRRAASQEAGFPWSGPEVSYPFPQYVGVTRSTHATQTQQLLQLLTGEEVAPPPDYNLPAEVTDGKKPEESQFSRDKAACLERNSEQTTFSYVFLVGEDSCYNATTVTCGRCYRTTVAATSATSPAFIKEVQSGYDWASGRYPTWTESVWKGFSLRSFLQGDPSHDHLVLGLGVSIFLASLALVWWGEKHAVIIFSNMAGAELRIDSSVNT